MNKAIKLFLLFCFLFSGQSSIAQEPILDNFDATTKNGNVYLNWVIGAGSTCNGTNVYRSADKSNFYKIGDIAGICGNLDRAETYTFTDNNPLLNKVNHYRLELGFYGFYEIVSVEVIYIEPGSYQVRPHPADTQARIYFSNDSNHALQFSLFNLSGYKELSFTSHENYIDINTADLKDGLYLFSIVGEQNSVKVTGKLSVQH
jgi:hypothetical protein